MADDVDELGETADVFDHTEGYDEGVVLGFDWEQDADASKAKSITLNNSRMLDVHTWSEHPEVNIFVDAIYHDIFAGRNNQIRRTHVKVLLLDLYVNWCDDEDRYLSFSRNNNDYERGSRYNELHISRVTIAVVDALVETGLVEQEIGFFDRDRGKGKLSRIRSTEALRAKFRNARFSVLDISSHSERLTVELRIDDPESQKPSRVEYEPDERTETMSRSIEAYNSLLSRTFIDIPVLETNRLEIANGSPVFVNQRDKFVRRIFNRGSFDCGGRFYGGWWQRCPKEWRPKIFLNDQPTNEIDFSGLHIVMLYAEAGVPYWEAVGSDPYGIPVPDFLDDQTQTRSIAKSLMLVLVNADSVTSAYRAFRKKASSGSLEKKMTNDQLDAVRQSLVERHPVIESALGSDAGIRLMNRDSDITSIIIDTFTDKRIPLLTLHDSYLVPNGYEDYLIDVMGGAFESVMGMQLGNPDISVKEQSGRVEDLEMALMSWMPYENLPWQDRVEKNYKSRKYPDKSKRYIKEYKGFKEWLL
tara:strand:+ start:457 stop:2043 length:1587 start_codon:yes stop_codon:yes gene_type:complete